MKQFSETDHSDKTKEFYYSLIKPSFISEALQVLVAWYQAYNPLMFSNYELLHEHVCLDFSYPLARKKVQW